MPGDIRKFWLAILGSIITTIVLSGGAAYLGTEKALSSVITRLDNYEAWQKEVKEWQKDKEVRWLQYSETKGDIGARLRAIEANQANIERKLDEIYRLAKSR